MLNFIDKKFWKNKKVFITGHTGFKGSWLTLFLNHLGADVTGYSLPPNTRPSLFNLARIKNVVKKSVIADIRDYKRLQNELDKSKATIVVIILVIEAGYIAMSASNSNKTLSE